MVFETKKIQIETLGEYLQEVRASLHLTTAAVFEKTSIKIQYVESLESGKFFGLPADVYVYGFLKKLGQLYNLDPEVLILQYKKERGIADQQKKTMQKQVESRARGLFSGIVITPKFVSVFGGVVFVVVTVGYIVWQVVSINKVPNLTILQPSDRQVVSSSAVLVKGMTDPGTQLFINDQSVFVQTNGEFEVQIGLGNGPKDLVFLAKNKFEKSVVKTITVIGSIGGIEQPAAASGEVEVRLEFVSAATLEVWVDNSLPQTLVFSAGQSRTFSAQEKIILSISDGGAARVTYNGQNLGALGTSGQRLDRVPFFRESDSINKATTTK